MNGAALVKVLSIGFFLAINGINLSEAAPFYKNIDLSILPDGKVKVGNGPEINDEELKAKVAEFMRQKPRPQINILADKRVPYSTVANATREIQLAGYGPYFGFVGDPH